MTGYPSKKAAAQDKLDDDDLTIAYQSGYYDGKKAAQPAQEPVGRFAKFTDGIWREVTDGSAGQPLYTAPQQRPWVGLTDEEPMQIWDEVIKYAPSEMRIKDFALAIEVKLKEKNT